jgi:3',5'-cyclic AMP phosphodiesterase CpdA
MPIHLPPLPPVSRRRFIAGSLAAGAGLMSGGWLRGAEGESKFDPNRIALLSDTHIDADVKRIARDINMADHFRKACVEVLALDPPPRHVLINGDFAYGTGQAGDYAAAVEMLKPVREAGMPVHIALGNHDHRERFWAGIADSHNPDAAMKDKHVALLDTPRANWLLLDSLNVTNEARGALGADQLKWLAETLDANPEKPALIIVHHNLEIGDAAGHNGGVADTAELLEILSPRMQAKALFYGHTHRWLHEHREDGLHLVNLPACAYVFQPEQPSGWVDTRIGRSGATLELRCLNTNHPWHGQKLPMKWRKSDAKK